MGRIYFETETERDARERNGAGAQPTELSGWVPGGVTVRLRVVSPIGMGMRAATRLSRLAGDYPCNVRLRHGPVWADAKDILALMSLGVDAGSTLSIETSGNKADKAARMVAWMVGNSYDGETVRAMMSKDGNGNGND